MADLLSWLDGAKKTWEAITPWNEDEARRARASRPQSQIQRQAGLTAPPSLNRLNNIPQNTRPVQKVKSTTPKFTDYLNPFGEKGLFGVQQQKNFSNISRPVVNTLEQVQRDINSSDKKEGFQWDDAGDYGRFAANLVPGMVQGAVQAPSAIGRGVSGVDDQGNKLSGLQRAGSLADGYLSSAGLAIGGSGVLLKALAPKTAKAIAIAEAKKLAEEEAAKALVKNTLPKGVRGAIDLAKSAGKEGLEETVQTFAQDLADNGQLNARPQDYAQAAAMGALGGGMMHGGGKYINSVVRNATNAVDPAIRNTPRGRAMVANEVARQLVPGGTIAGRNAAGFADAQRQGLVFDGVDGKQRFEVDDSGAKYNQPTQLALKDRLKQIDTQTAGLHEKFWFDNSKMTPEETAALEAATSERVKVSEELSKSGNLTVGGLINHPELFRNYPELAGIKVKLTGARELQGNGSFNPKTGEMTLDSTVARDPKKALSTLLHEIQHAIQERENFARGSNGVLGGETHDQYLRSAGEAEARAVQARMNMPMSERYVKPELLDNLNPTGGLFVDYNPKSRIETALAENMTTLDKTLGGSPDDIISIYRGAPKNQKKINAGDFVTDMRELAESYTGDGNVLEMKVRKGDILDDLNEPGGNEYIYRPGADKEPRSSAKPRNTFDDSLDVPKEDLIVNTDSKKSLSVEQIRNHPAIVELDRTIDDLNRRINNLRRTGHSENFHTIVNLKKSQNIAIKEQQRIANELSKQGVMMSAENTPQKMTEEEYLASNGAPFMGGSEPALQQNRIKTKRGQSDAVNKVMADMGDNNARRAELRAKYKKKVASGEIVAPTATEERIRKANSNPDLQSTQAARRVLEKQGIDWRQETPTPQAPKAEALDPTAALKQEARKAEASPRLVVKKENIKNQIKKLEAKLENTSDMPGAYVTGRAGLGSSRQRQLSRNLDRTIDDSIKLTKLYEELNRVEGQIKRGATKATQPKVEKAAYSPESVGKIRVSESDSLRLYDYGFTGTKKEQLNSYAKYIEGGGDIKPGLDRINNQLTDLYNQALKESQPKAKNTIPPEVEPEVMYRGESPNRWGKGMAERGEGLYLGSKRLAGLQKDGTVLNDGIHSYKINPKAKLLQEGAAGSEYSKLRSQAYKEAGTKGVNKRFTELVREAGYDGVRSKEEIVVMNPSVILESSPGAPQFRATQPTKGAMSVEPNDVSSGGSLGKNLQKANRRSSLSDAKRPAQSPSRTQSAQEYQSNVSASSRLPEQRETQPAVRKTGKQSLTKADRSYGIDNTTEVVNKRGLVKSIKGSDEVSPDVRKKVEGEYNVRSTAKLALEADEFSKGNLKKVTSDVNERLAKPNGTLTDQDIADSLAVAKRLDAAKKFDESQQIYDRLSEHATKGGQAIQAYSLLKNRTPDGIKYQMLRQLKKAGVELNADDQVQVGRLIDNIRKTKPESESRNRALHEAMDYVSRRVPTNRGDKIINFWRAGLLTAPRTTGGNIVGNLTEATTRDLWANPIAVGVDKVFSTFTGKRTKTLAGGRIGGAKEGVSRGVDYLKTGYDPREVGSKFDIDKRSNYNNKIIDGYVNGVYKWMGAQDQPFYYAAKAVALRDMAKADGMNLGYKGKQLAEYVEQAAFDEKWQPQTFKTAKDATDYAKYAVYQNKTALGEIAKSIKTAADRKNVKFVADFIIPFTQVPSSVAMRIIDRTPVGIAKEMASQFRSKSFDQRAMSEAIGNGSFGIAVIGAGTALANAGLITGAYPDDDKERKLWQQEGKQEYSVKIGDRWHSLNYLQPFGTLLGIGKQVSDDKKEGKSDAEVWSKVGATAMQNVSDQSFLKGINGVISAINGPDRSASQFVKSTATSVMPNAIRSLVTASDRTQRDTKSIGNAMKGTVPGLRQTLPAKLDMFGQSLDSKDNFANMYLNPTNPSKAKEGGALVGELRRLQDSGNGIVTTTFAKNSIGGAKLNDEQVRNLNELVNSEVGERWRKLVSNDQYKAMSDEDKATALKKVKDAVANNVKAQFVKDNMIETTTDYKIKSIPEVPSVQSGGVKISSALKGDNKATLEQYNSMSAEDRDKWFNTENDAEYKYELAKYENDKANGTLTAAEDIRRKKSLRKDKVGKDYSKNARSLYELSKADLEAYLTTEEEGVDKQKLWEEINKYDRALYDAGLISYTKFRYGLGSGRKSGGRRGTGITQAKEALSLQAQMNKIRAPQTQGQQAPKSTPQMRQTALRKYAVKDAKISKKDTKIKVSKA